ncbi:MAG: hypothetical protein ACRDHY_04240, partial [Anaerolineales bacterium]
AFGGAILLYQLAVAFRTRPDPDTLLAPRTRVAGIIERAFSLTVILFLAPALWWLVLVSVVIRVWNGRKHPGRWAEAISGAALAFVLGILFRQGVGP